MASIVNVIHQLAYMRTTYVGDVPAQISLIKGVYSGYRSLYYFAMLAYLAMLSIFKLMHYGTRVCISQGVSKR